MKEKLVSLCSRPPPPSPQPLSLLLSVCSAWQRNTFKHCALPASPSLPFFFNNVIGPGFLMTTLNQGALLKWQK